MKNLPVPIFSSPDPAIQKSKERHLNWAINWINAEHKRVPHHLRVSAARSIASFVWPEEKLPGLTEKLWETGAVFVILNFARSAQMELHRYVSWNEITLDDQIGQGAVGKVFRGTYQGKPVAIKVSHEDSLAFSEEEFRFEVALMSALRHPNILPCLGACTIAPEFFYISPYQERGNLRMVLNSLTETLSWFQKIAIAIQIASGLKYLHSLRIIHRDIKSENILVGDDWEIQITDFGTTRFIGKYDRRTKDSMVGTAEWMAPEMLTEGKEYNEKVDVYSFGIVLYELFTRNYPYYEIEKKYQIIDKVLAGYRPTFVEEAIPFKSMKQLMINCWHKLPRKRPSFSTILEKLLLCEQKLKKNM